MPEFLPTCFSLRRACARFLVQRYAISRLVLTGLGRANDDLTCISSKDIACAVSCFRHQSRAMKFSFKSFKGEKGFEGRLTVATASTLHLSFPTEPQQNQQAKRKEQVRRAQKSVLQCVR